MARSSPHQGPITRRNLLVSHGLALSLRLYQKRALDEEVTVNKLWISPPYRPRGALVNRAITAALPASPNPELRREVLDRVTQPFGQRDLGLPTEPLLGQGDVGTAARRVVRRQGLEGQRRLAAG